MTAQHVRVRFCILSLSFFIFVSCQKNNNSLDEAVPFNNSLSSSAASVALPNTLKWKSLTAALNKQNARILKTDQYYSTFFSNPEFSVPPSECKATALDAMVEDYISKFEFWDYVMFPDYKWINQLSALMDRSKQYFGRTGQYTQLVTKDQRRLEAFWQMPGTIRINAQHSETLGNRDKIAQVFIQYSGATKEDGYYVADQIIQMNKESKVFPESPLLSFDGFTTTSKVIVIGDGLVEALTTTGIADEIVITGLIAHEWSHQVQFENFAKWYGVAPDERLQTPAVTRQLELEADFLAAYFLTHKKGAALNWKRVAAFNELFFNVGDCEFTSGEHHGTPLQRSRAATLGYTLASTTLPMGHILDAEQLHTYFMKHLKSLL